eukprot:jgi/Hompol1/6021/HPOL_000891-RA
MVRKNDRKVIHSGVDAIKARDIVEGDESVLRPDAEAVQSTTERTRAALEKLVEGRLALGKTSDLGGQKKGTTFVKYTPADQQAALTASGAKSRIIAMVEAPVDPMEPPRHKHKKVPRGPPSPPAPVMHSPPRKVSVEVQREWVIPPCVSSWKNAKGYTIPLDKRLANDGRGLQSVSINDNFAKLSEALYLADRHAREEVRLRSEMQAKLAEKEKRQKEETLRLLAQKAREERSGLVSSVTLPAASGAGAATAASANDANDLIASAFAESLDGNNAADGGEAGSDVDGDGDEELTAEERRQMKERDALRRDKARQREREMRMAHMGSETKARVLAHSTADRDVSEKIALGLAKPTASKDTLFDQRLFNQSAGISSGFGDEDSYGLYDKPLFQGSSASAIYRPKRAETQAVPGVHTERLEGLLGDNAPHKAFQGTERAGGPGGAASVARSGPVAFEKEVDEFGFQDFMSSAKRGSAAADGDDNDNTASKNTKRSRY